MWRISKVPFSTYLSTWLEFFWANLEGQNAPLVLEWKKQHSEQRVCVCVCVCVYVCVYIHIYEKHGPFCVKKKGI